MTSDHSPSLDEIREAAKKASVYASPWESPDGYFVYGGDRSSTLLVGGSPVATYIAMMDPQTTLAICDEIAQLRERVFMHENSESGDVVFAELRAERAEELVHVLRAALEETVSHLDSFGALNWHDGIRAALDAYRAFTEANPIPGETEEQ